MNNAFSNRPNINTEKEVDAELELLLTAYNLRIVELQSGILLLTRIGDNYVYINNRWECIRPIDIKKIKNEDLFINSHRILRISITKYLQKGGNFLCRKHTKS